MLCPQIRETNHTIFTTYAHMLSPMPYIAIFCHHQKSMASKLARVTQIVLGIAVSEAFVGADR